MDVSKEREQERKLCREIRQYQSGEGPANKHGLLVKELLSDLYS